MSSASNFSVHTHTQNTLIHLTYKFSRHSYDYRAVNMSWIAAKEFYTYFYVIWQENTVWKVFCMRCRSEHECNAAHCFVQCCSYYPFLILHPFYNNVETNGSPLLWHHLYLELKIWLGACHQHVPAAHTHTQATAPALVCIESLMSCTETLKHHTARS